MTLLATKGSAQSQVGLHGQEFALKLSCKSISSKEIQEFLPLIWKYRLGSQHPWLKYVNERNPIAENDKAF